MSEASVETRIHEAMHRLTAAEKRAARGLLAHYPMIGLSPLAEFAEEAGASAATILRFIAQLGFKSYPDFQRALREEFEERAKSPLQRSAGPPPRGAGSHFLDEFMAQTTANMQATAGRIPASEFEAACARLAQAGGACHILGGRFTDALAQYMEAHLRIVRADVRRLDGRPASRADQILDVRGRDTAVLFDIRRYDPQLLDAAEQLAGKRAFTILLTDQWISPVSKYAKIVLPCCIGMDRTWDANAALFAVVEAMVARTTELAWPTAAKRIGSIERL